MMRKVVNTDSSRTQRLRELIETHPRVIVFYNFDYELEMLRTLCSDELKVFIKNPTESLSQESSQKILPRSSEKQDGSCGALTERWSGTQIQIAEWNGHKHETLPTSERWVYLVQYVAGAEAWNCTTTNTVIFYSLTYSYRNFEQAMGRIDRLNTPYENLHYYVLMSKSWLDKAIAKALRAKQNFNEKKIELYT